MLRCTNFTCIIFSKSMIFIILLPFITLPRDWHGADRIHEIWWMYRSNWRWRFASYLHRHGVQHRRKFLHRYGATRLVFELDAVWRTARETLQSSALVCLPVGIRFVYWACWGNFYDKMCIYICIQFLSRICLQGCDRIQGIVCEATNMEALFAYSKAAEENPSIKNALTCLQSRCGV